MCHKEEGRRNTVVGADGAALIVGDNWVGAVCRVLADNLVAHDCATVAHTDLAWLWFPYVPVSKHLAVYGAATANALRGRHRWKLRGGRMNHRRKINYCFSSLNSNVRYETQLSRLLYHTK